MRSLSNRRHAARAAVALLLPLISFLFSPTPAFGACVLLEVRQYFDGIQVKNEGKRFIRVEEGRITRVAASRSASDKSCKTFDLSGRFVAPGLMDLHTHVLLEDRSFGARLGSELVRVARMNEPQRLSSARGNLRSYLYSGFTSLRDLGNSGEGLDRKISNAPLRAARMSPRLFFSGPGIAVAPGQFNPEASPEVMSREYLIVSEATSAEDTVTAEGAVQRAASYGAEWIKLYADNDPSPGRLSPDLMRRLVRAAHLRHLPVAIHASSDASVRASLDAGATSIEHGDTVSTETLNRMATQKVFFVPTDFSARQCLKISNSNPDPLYRNCGEYRRLRGDRLLRAHQAGVPLAFGSDYYFPSSARGGRGAEALDSLLAWVESGLPPLTVLVAATSGAARVLGRDDLGLIRVGAVADIIALRESPVADFSNLKDLRFLMKDGAVLCGGKSRCVH